MSWAALGRPAAVCATVAAATTFWLHRCAPAAMTQESPTLVLDSPPLGPLWDFMSFLDARVAEWKVESSSFPKPNAVARLSDEPKVQVLRLGSSYLPDSKGGRPIPFMRVVGFFPDALPEEIFRFMTDLQLRRRWDHNYHMFCKWDPPVTVTAPESMTAVKRPIETVAKKTPICRGDTCRLVPDIEEEVLEQGWFAHRVGHSLLEKFGMADRLFAYQRRSVCYTKSGCASSPLKLYDVLYSGSGETVKKAAEQSEPFATWLHSCESEQEATRVSVNYQHILIIPIADAAIQLWADPLPFSFAGSMVDERTTKLIYDAFMASERLHRETRRLDGTLMIMTSANDVQMPSGVPMWTQRMLATFFSNYAQREMLKAVRAYRTKD
ncbi:hypothetical protein TraAM80_04545 [Trypanosoma rangeli]|uniref:START domain-containing protein n=1 Tax=Trypanosoma rangeli TaxID=5698 RepID=A0A422NJ09_TRYRA|nr:uncharacterized protein TraAM80_04545 [Trypanosoma rangeli]RNF05445.1 hypothetical protein TraAM80_04545 [Trypanosoma rangeli]|eukprot:RNF05445.1 hypothetical protein TraAM80_04545 [Trypanosoma rangeli]